MKEEIEVYDGVSSLSEILWCTVGASKTRRPEIQTQMKLEENETMLPHRQGGSVGDSCTLDPSQGPQHFATPPRSRGLTPFCDRREDLLRSHLHVLANTRQPMV